MPSIPAGEVFRIAAHLGIRAGDPPLFERSAASARPEDQIAFAAQAGFGAISDNNLLGRPDDEQSRIGKALAQHGLAMGSFVLAPPGRFLPWTTPGIDVAAALAPAQEASRRVGGGLVLVVLGDDGSDRKRQLELVRGNLERAARIAASFGLTLGLEATSAVRVPGALVERAEGAARIVGDVGHPALRLVLDTCHMALVGDDPVDAIRSHGELAAAIQIADMPGRVEPGAGRLDLVSVVAELRSTRFSGLVEAEFWPSQPGATGERAALSALARLFEQ